MSSFMIEEDEFDFLKRYDLIDSIFTEKLLLAGFLERDFIMESAGIYRHFKGNYYEVLGIAVDLDTKEEYVLYRQMYDEFGYWIRPKEMFFGERMTEDGPVVRFAKVGISFENILEKEDIFHIKIRHSETRKNYKVIQSYNRDDERIFEIKIEDETAE